MITVIDVMHELNIEITSDLSWSVGNKVRDLWRNENGELPQKRLREKTAGEGGSHCFAVYPENWRDRIKLVILEFKVKESRQLGLPLWSQEAFV